MTSIESFRQDVRRVLEGQVPSLLRGKALDPKAHVWGGRRASFDYPEARAWLATKGFDPVLGARPLARVIQHEVRDPLTDEILFGKLEHGGTVTVGLDGGRLIQALAWARSGNRARVAITAARVGQAAGAVLLTGGVTALALGYLDGIWAALIGLAMIGTARAQARDDAEGCNC